MKKAVKTIGTSFYSLLQKKYYLLKERVYCDIGECRFKGYINIQWRGVSCSHQNVPDF